MHPVIKKRLIAVCDGKKALYLEHSGHGHDPLDLQRVDEHEDLPTRDINSDAPGRAFSSHGVRRSSLDQADAHDIAEQRFLKSVAHRLEKFQYDELILVAPARAIGVLRQELSASARDKLKLEIEKDLIRLPLAEIKRHLAGALKPTYI